MLKQVCSKIDVFGLGVMSFGLLFVCASAGAIVSNIWEQYSNRAGDDELDMVIIDCEVGL